MTNLGLEEGIASVVKQSVALLFSFVVMEETNVILESCLLRAVCDRFLLYIFLSLQSSHHFI